MKHPEPTAEQRILAVIVRFCAIYRYAPDLTDLHARLPFGKERIRRTLHRLAAAGRVRHGADGWAVVEGTERTTP
jgi:hypothetical protein